MASSKVIVKDAGWKQLMRNLKHIDKATVHVGVLAGEGASEGGFDLVALAATQEYGSSDGHTPSRPFLRMTFQGPPQWLVDTTKKLAKPVIEGKLDIERALGLLGAVAVTKVRETVTNGAGVPPENAPSTIAKKGSSRPLVDTGRMLNAVSWRVFLDGDQ